LAQKHHGSFGIKDLLPLKDGQRRACASAAVIFASPAGVPAGSENDPYGLP
jgi:hypothetical protein